MMFSKSSKLDRINKMQQLRDKKRSNKLAEKRLGSGIDVPRLITLVQLGSNVNIDSVVESIFSSSDKNIQKSPLSNVYKLYKKYLLLI